MILIYKTVPARQIRKDAKEAIAKCEAFFAANPERETATVGVWYGKAVTIHRDSIKEDMKKAMAQAIGKKE